MVLFPFGELTAQSISGTIYSNDGDPVPFANLYFRQLESGTSSDENGKYFLSLDPGEYDLVITAIGFETKTSIALVDGHTELNFILDFSDVQLSEVTIKASKKDPAFEIIRKTIERKEKFLSDFSSLRCQVYIKAVEEIDIQQKEKQTKKEEKAEFDINDLENNLIEEKRRKEEEKFSKINMVEMELVYNYEFPNKLKEERTAYKLYGKDDGLYIPLLSQTSYNIYENSMRLEGVTPTTLISPLSKTAILSYKYKLLSSVPVDGKLVHEIEVIPRKKGNATLRGKIFIIDEEWAVSSYDLSLNPGSMPIFDELTIKQGYTELEGGRWFPNEIELIYFTKVGKKKKYNGTTFIKFKDLQLDYEFPQKFFGNELSVITQEAYDRDSTYWNRSRPQKLEAKERALVEYRDSIETILNSDEYKDSVQLAFNKVEFWEVVYEGLGFQNHRKKESIFFTPLLGLLQFQVVGGFRVGPWFSYYRRFENDQSLYTWNNFSIGLNNKSVIGRHVSRYRYDPYHFGDIEFILGRGYRPLNPFDAYLNQLRSSLYYQYDNIGLGHSRELFNGFMLQSYFERTVRKDLRDLDTYSVFEELLEAEQELVFEPYEVFTSNISIQYTPGQKYMREPNRKVLLGSKFPTFSVRHVKGWKNVFSSDVDWDYLEFSIFQDLNLGVFGNSKYNLDIGEFVRDNALPIIDVKRFRESDPILYSDPLSTFQLLDTSLTTRDPFVEFHWIHHFNGALINNIPLIKKTRISFVTGGGFLFVDSENYNHAEVFLGLERIFKLGPRRRLRLGVYAVGAQSNIGGVRSDYKFSIDILDTWKKDWSF